MGEALAPVREQVVIATKFGFKLRPDGAPGWVGLDSRPEHIKQVARARSSDSGSMPSTCSINTASIRTCPSKTWRER